MALLTELGYADMCVLAMRGSSTASLISAAVEADVNIIKNVMHSGDAATTVAAVKETYCRVVVVLPTQSSSVDDDAALVAAAVDAEILGPRSK